MPNNDRELTLPLYMTKKKKPKGGSGGSGPSSGGNNKSPKSGGGSAKPKAKEPGTPEAQRKPVTAKAAPAKAKAAPAKAKAAPVKAKTAPVKAKRSAPAKRSTAKQAGKGSTKPAGRSGGALRSMLIAVVALTGILAIIYLAGRENGAAEDIFASDITFLSGVRIEGQDVSGKTAEEARTLLSDTAAHKPEEVDYTIGEYALTAVEIGAKDNLAAVLAEAMNYGRSGTIAEKAAAREQLNQDGVNFSIGVVADGAMLRQALSGFSKWLDKAPVEPYAEPSIGEDNAISFSYSEGEDGRALNVSATAERVEKRLASGVFAGEIEPAFDYIAPGGSLELIKENTQFRSSFTTRFRRSSSDEVIKNRVSNIRKAAGIINCVTVAPGEEWSFNGCVGPRTKDTGWALAKGISGGKEYTMQAGGGICQVSTTLYNALLAGAVEVTDRSAHSIPSDYVDKGLDATVDTSGIDLKFKNDTGAPLYVFIYITEDPESSRYLNVTTELYGAPLPDGVTYKARSVVIETTPREDTKYTDDPAIPAGYQMIKVERHDGFMAEAYLDKYVDGELKESTLLYTDKYKGNVAEISVGTGDPAKVSVPEGAEKIN